MSSSCQIQSVPEPTAVLAAYETPSPSPLPSCTLGQDSPQLSTVLENNYASQNAFCNRNAKLVGGSARQPKVASKSTTRKAGKPSKSKSNKKQKPKSRAQTASTKSSRKKAPKMKVPPKKSKNKIKASSRSNKRSVRQRGGSVGYRLDLEGCAPGGIAGHDAYDNRAQSMF